MRRTLDSDEFQTEFPDLWDSFLDFPLFADNAEECRFKVEMFEEDDEETLGLVSAWHDGEKVAIVENDVTWVEVNE